MKAFATILCAIAVIWLGYILWPLVDQAEAQRRNDRAYYRSELEQLELAREQWQLDQQQAYAPLDNAIVYMWIVGVLVLAAAVAYGALDHYARRRALVWPNTRGDLPMPYADVIGGRLNDISGHLLELRRLGELAAAQRPAVPNVITYSPHYEYEHRQQIEGQPAAALLPSALPAPAFAALLGDVVRPGADRLVFGADADSGELVTGSWLDLFSVGIGGLSGSGKSWTAASLLTQSAICGAKLALIDPHGGNPESLTTRLQPLQGAMLCRPARTLAEQDATIALVMGELERRKAADQAGEPWIVAIDEYAALQRSSLGPIIADLLESLGQEGRKYNVFGLACSQVWTAARAGGTETRDALASAFVHRLRPAQARYLTGLTADALPRDLLELPAGQCYFLSNNGEMRRLMIPRMTTADITQAAQLVGSASAPSQEPGSETRRSFGFQSGPARNPFETHLKPTSETRETSSGRDIALAPWEARALGLFGQGKTIGEIVKAIWGDISGPKYNRLRDEVETLIRRHWRGSGDEQRREAA